MKCELKPLEVDDINEIVAAFKSIGWSKPASIYEGYLNDQSAGDRSVFVAKVGGKFCGYVTLKYMSEYPGFEQSKIPEISDLNVLPEFRNQGVGTLLVNACETLVRDKNCKHIGIGVGMTSDYGNAQRLYVRLGYVPDGQGLHYKNYPVRYGEEVCVDDDLVLYFTKAVSS